MFTNLLKNPKVLFNENRLVGVKVINADSWKDGREDTNSWGSQL